MSMSLRDQLLKAGLINKKQANDAERQQQRQERAPRPKKQNQSADVKPKAPPAGIESSVSRDSKAARDLALNRQNHAKAEKKARLAQIKQLIDQNRIVPGEGSEAYNFVDGGKIRRVAADASIRSRLSRGEVAIVRHQGQYELVPATIATRIQERDEHAVIFTGVVADGAPPDDGYKEFVVPDDLIW